MKSFFQKNERKYLRKKSALVQDYMLAGMGIVSIGLFCNYYNNKLNPSDPEEDTDQTEVLQKIGVTDLYQNKILNALKAKRGSQYLQEEQIKKLEQEQNEKKVKVLQEDNTKK
ncbi:hypothetical protein ABPG74_014892 [Tetrahymena malaccensis]